MKIHPVAELIPLMAEVEVEELANDIATNGLREPIVVYRGQIVDGRHRWKACEKIGVIPKTVEWDGKGSLTAYVMSKNLYRRHLTQSQRAAVGADALPRFEAEAKERQKGGQGGKLLRAQMPEAKGRARDDSAAAAQVSPRYIQEAKAIKEHSPALFKDVKDGKKTITQARREVQREKVSRKTQSLPSSKYRVIYADPPWKYGDGLTENYGAAKFHYPSMTIAELCTLPIADLAEDNAVLFLWVTSPILPECFAVIKAWGFTYKASFVWDKIKHNMGHYNSVRHEFLLICTRGSCLPDSDKLIDSVQSIERSKTHSQKPDEFRSIIETMYEHGKKIELFARSEAVNWARWGNE